MSISVRSAGPDDVDLILGFIKGLAAYEKLSDEVEATAADLARDLFAPNPRVFCEIAEYDGVPAGFTLWYYTYSTFRGRHGIWLEDLFVDPNMRGKRIGLHLMANLAQKCRDENLARFEWSVLDWNTPAIDFYKSIGAQLLTDWTICRVDGEALGALAHT